MPVGVIITGDGIRGVTLITAVGITIGTDLAGALAGATEIGDGMLAGIIGGGDTLMAVTMAAGGGLTIIMDMQATTTTIITTDITMAEEVQITIQEEETLIIIQAEEELTATEPETDLL